MASLDEGSPSSSVHLSLGDRLTIEDLAARYNQAIDLGDPDSWANCFTPDGVFIVEPGGEQTRTLGLTTTRTTRGTEALREFARATQSVSRFRHWSTNRVLLDGDVTGSVPAISYMAIAYLSGPRAGQVLTGVMTDELCRTNAGWRFKSRHMRFDT
jgi:hypothetical protein